MPRGSRRPTLILATWSRPCLRTLPGSPTRAEPNRLFAEQPEASPRVRFRRSSALLKAHFMQDLSPRHVKTEESLRLGVVSGWYSTKVSGTFVSGPHDSEADCLRRIAEIDLAPVKAAKAKPVE